MTRAANIRIYKDFAGRYFGVAIYEGDEIRHADACPTRKEALQQLKMEMADIAFYSRDILVRLWVRDVLERGAIIAPFAHYKPEAV